MIRLIHLVFIFEQYVLSLILYLESEISLARWYATIPIIERFLGFIRQVTS